jgi:hypothetical protein
MKKVAWYSLVTFCVLMTFYHHGGVAVDQNTAGANWVERTFAGVSLQVREGVDYLLDRADLYCSASIEELQTLVERWTKYMEGQRQKGKA